MKEIKNKWFWIRLSFSPVIATLMNSHYFLKFFYLFTHLKKMDFKITNASLFLKTVTIFTKFSYSKLYIYYSIYVTFLLRLNIVLHLKYSVFFCHCFSNLYAIWFSHFVYMPYAKALSILAVGTGVFAINYLLCCPFHHYGLQKKIDWSITEQLS